jgi:hypothetical protein
MRGGRDLTLAFRAAQVPPLTVTHAILSNSSVRVILGS